MSTYGIGNFGHFRGYDNNIVSELIEHRQRKIEMQIKEVGTQILEYVSYDDYCAWIDGLPETDNVTLLKTMQERLDELETEECTCGNPFITCPACRHAAYHQWYMKEENENV